MKKIVWLLLCGLQVINVCARSSEPLEAMRLRIYVPEQQINNYDEIYPELAEGFNILRNGGQSIPSFHNFMLTRLSIMSEVQIVAQAQAIIIDGMKDKFCLILKNMIQHNRLSAQITDPVFLYVMNFCHDFMQEAVIDWINSYRYSSIVGHTLLIEACKKNEVANVTMLLSFGADTNIAITVTGYTALHFTAMKNAAESAQVLIVAGADINQPDALGATPLMTALKWQSLDVAKILLDAGANRTGAERMAQLAGLGEWFAANS